MGKTLNTVNCSNCNTDFTTSDNRRSRCDSCKSSNPLQRTTFNVATQSLSVLQPPPAPAPPSAAVPSALLPPPVHTVDDTDDDDDTPAIITTTTMPFADTHLTKILSVVSSLQKELRELNLEVTGLKSEILDLKINHPTMTSSKNSVIDPAVRFSLKSVMKPSSTKAKQLNGNITSLQTGNQRTRHANKQTHGRNSKTTAAKTFYKKNSGSANNETQACNVPQHKRRKQQSGNQMSVNPSSKHATRRRAKATDSLLYDDNFIMSNLNSSYRDYGFFPVSPASSNWHPSLPLYSDQFVVNNLNLEYRDYGFFPVPDSEQWTPKADSLSANGHQGFGRTPCVSDTESPIFDFVDGHFLLLGLAPVEVLDPTSRMISPTAAIKPKLPAPSRCVLRAKETL